MREDLLETVEQDAQKRFPKANVKLVDKIHDGGVCGRNQGVIAGCSGRSCLTISPKLRI